MSTVIIILIIMGIIQFVGLIMMILLIDEIQNCHYRLEHIDDKLDRVIKRISILHNEKTGGTKLLAWLTPEEREKATRMQKENPELYSFVIECLKLFLYGEQGNDKGN